MGKIFAIIKKQGKETFKNKEVLVQFVLLPVMAIIMTSTIKLPDMPKDFFVVLFAAMYVGMAPLTSVTAVIAEEKEKNTLRLLRMSNVTAFQYLLGIGSYILLMCLGGSIVFAVAGGYRDRDFLQFIVVMAAGIVVSMLIGAVIGTFSKSQMNATAVVVPVMMVFSFVPMIATFNEKIKKISEFVYSQQISNILNDIGDKSIEPKSIGIIFINMLIAAALFTIFYRRSGLEC